MRQRTASTTRMKTGSTPLLATMSSSPVDCVCLATADSSCSFEAKRFTRRALNPLDVLIEMAFCGICHTDLHAAAGQ